MLPFQRITGILILEIMKGLQNSPHFPRRLKVPWHNARQQFDVQLKGTLCKQYSYRPENMARFGTQKEASRTKSIKFPFPFIFLGIVFYQIVGLQVGQAETLWPRDTYGEYKKIELWRSKHLSHLISISSYGCTRKVAKHGKSIRVRESVRS